MADITQTGPGVGVFLAPDLVKLHAKVDFNHDDVLIDAYISAAQTWIEKACDTRFLTTEYTSIATDFTLDFKTYPNPDIQSITYVDELDATNTLTDYEVRDGCLYVENPPTAKTVTVVFLAGLGVGNIPANLHQAGLLLACAWYDQRSEISEYSAASIPMGVRALIGVTRSFVHKT